MSRFYRANVQDRTGEILSQSLVSAFDRYRMGKRQQQDDAQAEQEQADATALQDLALAQQGIRRGPAPMEAAVPVPVLQGGRIAGVEAAPKQFTRLTDQFYRDERFVADQAKRQQESALADALMKAKVPLLARQQVDPVGFQLDRAKLAAEVERLQNPPQPPVRLSTVTTDEGVFAFNPVTGQTGNRLGSRPRPQTAADTGDGTVSKQDFQRISSLRDDYQKNPLVAKAYGIANAVSGLEAALAGEGGLDDLSIIYETVKLFDPGSVVKEGEIQLMRTANSLPGQLTTLISSWNAGKKLTPQMRAQIRSLMERKKAEADATVQPVQADYGQMARRYGVSQDSAFIAPSPFRGLGAGASRQPAQQPAAVQSILTPVNPYRRGR